MLRRGLIFGALVSALWGADVSQHVETPTLGFVRLGDGTIRAVYGGPGSFVVGPAKLKGVVSASFSNAGGLVAYADRIDLVDAHLQFVDEQPTRGPALVSIGSDRNSGIAWVAADAALIFWTGSEFRLVHAGNLPSGRVKALARKGDTAVLTFGDQQATVSLADGNLIDCHPTPDALNDAVAERMNDEFVHLLPDRDDRTWVEGRGHRWELPAARDSQ